MCKILNLSQGSGEWLEERKKWATASEMAAIMGIPGAYKSRDQVLREKLTGVTQEASEFQKKLFEKGHQAEIALRAAAEDAMGLRLDPCVVLSETRGILASLDGFDSEQGIIVEMKYASGKVLDLAKKGEIHEPYHVQVQTQMLCTAAEKGFVFILGPEGDSYLISVEPDRDLQIRIAAAAKAFMADLKAGVSPDLEIQDARMDELRKLLSTKANILDELKEPLALLDETEKRIDELKKSVAGDFTQNTILGSGVIISKSKPPMELDKKALEKSGVNLSEFMKPGKQRVSVKLAQEEEIA